MLVRVLEKEWIFVYLIFCELFRSQLLLDISEVFSIRGSSVDLCVSYGSQNKQRLFLYTALNNRLL